MSIAILALAFLLHEPWHKHLFYIFGVPIAFISSLIAAKCGSKNWYLLSAISGMLTLQLLIGLAIEY